MGVIEYVNVSITVIAAVVYVVALCVVIRSVVAVREETPRAAGASVQRCRSSFWPRSV